MRALVLSGGAEKGAFQVGVLKHLMGDLNINYDMFCGVSVGALNASFLSMYQDNKLAVGDLENLWLNLRTEKVYKRWFPFGRWHALWEKSFYDSSPLRDLIHSKIDLACIRSGGKKVAVGAVSITSGQYWIFDQTSEHFIDAVLASASFPGMLTPVKFDNQLWTDGGIKEISPIKMAIDAGADEIDVIVTSPETRIRKYIEAPTTIDILKRSIDLSTDRIMSNDIKMVQLHNQLEEKNKRFIKLNIYRPKENLVEDLLNFDHNKIVDMINIGYLNAKARTQ